MKNTEDRANEVGSNRLVRRPPRLLGAGFPHPCAAFTIDDVYRMTDAAFRAGDFDLIDRWLAFTEKSEPLADDILLALATTSLAAKSKLPSRAAFVARLAAQGLPMDGLIETNDQAHP